MSFNIELDRMHSFTKGRTFFVKRYAGDSDDEDVPDFLRAHVAASEDDTDAWFTEIIFESREPTGLPVAASESTVRAREAARERVAASKSPKSKKSSQRRQKSTAAAMAASETAAAPASQPVCIDGVAVISSVLMCALKRIPYRGVHYTFLMTHALKGKKTSAHIGWSTNPMLDLHLHNSLGTNDRTTSTAAPYWVLDMVLGPFICLNKAKACSKEWVSHTRGKPSKRKKGHLLSKLYDVNLYSRALKRKERFVDYLRRKAPATYVAAYESLGARVRTMAG